MDTAIVAGGCFWCVEAVFENVRGVLSLQCGYTGGWLANPRYEQVCTGETGHAEALRIGFDPAILSYGALLDLFLGTHDPTQKDGQGNDIGSQYRSAIFPLDPGQEQEARAALRRAAARLARPIATAIEPAGPWYAAEEAHQGYFRRVGDRNPYCTLVIAPKVAKLKAHFPAALAHTGERGS